MTWLFLFSVCLSWDLISNCHEDMQLWDRHVCILLVSGRSCFIPFPCLCLCAWGCVWKFALNNAALAVFWIFRNDTMDYACMRSTYWWCQHGGGAEDSLEPWTSEAPRGKRRVVGYGAPCGSPQGLWSTTRVSTVAAANPAGVPPPGQWSSCRAATIPVEVPWAPCGASQWGFWWCPAGGASVGSPPGDEVWDKHGQDRGDAGLVGQRQPHPRRRPDARWMFIHRDWPQCQRDHLWIQAGTVWQQKIGMAFFCFCPFSQCQTMRRVLFVFLQMTNDFITYTFVLEHRPKTSARIPITRTQNANIEMICHYPRHIMSKQAIVRPADEEPIKP